MEPEDQHGASIDIHLHEMSCIYSIPQLPDPELSFPPCFLQIPDPDL